MERPTLGALAIHPKDNPMHGLAGLCGIRKISNPWKIHAFQEKSEHNLSTLILVPSVRLPIIDDHGYGQQSPASVQVPALGF